MLKQIQRLPFAPVVALMFAAVAAVLVLATPVWLLEHAVVQIGLPEIVSQAAPPLGTKARFLLVLLAAGGAGCAAFIASFPFRDTKPRKAQVVTVQPLHRADAEAPAFNRPSVFAPPPLDDEPNLPSFLAQPLARIAEPDSAPVAEDDDDELLLDSLMIVDDAEPINAVAVQDTEDHFVAAVRTFAEEMPVLTIDLPPMPDIFIQPETVLHLEPAPVPPPQDPVPVEVVPQTAPRPRIVEHREPTIAELMERFQRGLESLKQMDTSPLDDPALRNALTQLERIAVGGR